MFMKIVTFATGYGLVGFLAILWLMYAMGPVLGQTANTQDPQGRLSVEVDACIDVDCTGTVLSKVIFGYQGDEDVAHCNALATEGSPEHLVSKAAAGPYFNSLGQIPFGGALGMECVTTRFTSTMTTVTAPPSPIAGPGG